MYKFPDSIKFQERTNEENGISMTYDAVTRKYVSTHHVIDTPHENTKKGFVRTKQLNLLMFNSKVFLFELTKPARHLRRTGHVSCAGAYLRTPFGNTSVARTMKTHGNFFTQSSSRNCLVLRDLTRKKSRTSSR